MLELETYRERTYRRIKPAKLAQAVGEERNSSAEVIPHLWQHRDQLITSVVTSVNSTRLPALFNRMKWQPGTRNLDLGAGKYHENVTRFLKEADVENWAFDPFSLTREANLEAIRHIHSGQCHTVTCTNCANVIQDPFDRDILYLRAHDALRPGGTFYLQLHQGDKSNIGRISQKSRDGKALAWQENRRTREYIKDIEHLFSGIVVRDNIIIAKKH